MANVITKCSECPHCKKHATKSEYHCEPRVGAGFKRRRLPVIDTLPHWCPLPEDDGMST